MKSLIVGFFLGVFTVLLTWQAHEYYQKYEFAQNLEKANDVMKRVEHCKIQYLKRISVTEKSLAELDKNMERQIEQYKELNVALADAYCKDINWNGALYMKDKWWSLPKG